MNMLSVNLTAAGCEGGFNWYGFLIGSGMVICIIIAYFMGNKRGYYKDLVFDISIICIPLAIVGARLYYVIFDILGNGATDWTFLKIIGVGGHGLAGLAIYGGLIGACIGGVIVHFWKRKKPPKEKATFLQMCDLAFTVIILGQAIGRWGNFVNQEAYGTPITNPALQWFPFGVFIDNCTQANCCGGAAHWHLATFFYESMLNAIGFIVLMCIYNGKRKSFDGFSVACYCIWYGCVRFFIEGFRTDSLYLWPDGLRVSQLLSAVMVLFGIGFIIAHVYLARNKGLRPFILVPADKLDNSYYGYDKSILSHPNVYEKNKNGFWRRMFGRTDDVPEPLEEVPPEDPENPDGEPDATLAGEPEEEIDGVDGLRLDSRGLPIGETEAGWENAGEESAPDGGADPAKKNGDDRE